jgi:hypothetical protein
VSSSPTPASPSPNRWLLPLIVFVVALGIRLLGIGWGLPSDRHQQSFHPDEPVVWFYSQQVQPAAFDFTPGFYNYGTLYLTALKVATDVTAGYTGGGLEPQKPEEAWKFVGRSHMAGRWISALAGSATALLALLILRRFTNDLGAVCGGLFIAFAPAHVVHSRFQTVDVLAAFLIALSAYFALRIIPLADVEEKWNPVKLAILSGTFAGLGAGTKYTGILCLLTLWVAVFGAVGAGKWKVALAGTGAAILAFLISTPGILLESKQFLDGFMYETRHVKEGHGLIFEGTSSGFVFHLANLFFGAGLLMGLFGLIGLFGATYRKHWWAIALAAFFVPYYIVIAGAEVKFIRYTFPLYIGLAIGFGWLMGTARNKGGTWHAIVALGLLGLGGIFGGGLQTAAKYSTWMMRPDPRDLAGDYLRSVGGSIGLVSDPWFYTPSIHPPLGRRLIYEAGMPMVGLAPFGEYFDRLTANLEAPQIIRYVPVNSDGTRDLKARVDWDERLLTDSRPQYVVYSSFENEGLDRIGRLSNPSPAGKTTFDRAKTFMDRLRSEYTLDRVFGSGEPMIHDMMYVQPRLWVWKRKPDL